MGENSDINRISNPLTANMNANVNADALEEARLRYDRSTHTTYLRQQSSKVTGEQAMRNYVRQAYRDRIQQEIMAPRRGTSPRATPIFDGLFELDNDEFIVAEGKGGRSHMGDTKAGKQFTPKWFAARLIELEELGKNDLKAKELARRLRTAWNDGKITALSIEAPRYDFKIPTGSKNTNVAQVDVENYKVVDWTDKWNEHIGVKSKAKPLVDYGPTSGRSNANLDQLPSLGKSSTHTTNLDLSRPSQITNVVRGVGNVERGFVQEKAMISSAEKISHAAESGLQAAKKLKTISIGVKAWRATRYISKAFLTFFVPLKIADALLEVALSLWEMQREKDERKRRDRQRALEAVFKHEERIEAQIKSIVTNDPILQDLMNSWDSNPSLSGFLYGRVVANVDKISFGSFGYDKELEDYTTYIVRDNNIFVIPITTEKLGTIQVDWSAIGEKKEIEMADSELLNPDLRFSRKTTQPHILRYTIYPPLITPFDIVVARINNLFLDTVHFIGNFSNFGGALIEGFFGFDYRYDYQNQFLVWLGDFEPPLDKSRCDYCLRFLHWAAKRLSEHAQTPKYEYRDTPWKGWQRRRQLLDLMEGKNSFLRFADKLDGLVKKSAQTPKIQSDIAELRNGAETIDMDLRRITRDIGKPEYFYYGPNYKISARAG